MAKISVYKRTSVFIDCSELVKELGDLGHFPLKMEQFNQSVPMVAS